MHFTNQQPKYLFSFFSSRLILFVKEGTAPMWEGYFLVAALLIAATAQSLLHEHYIFQYLMTGIRLRSTVMGMVYRKVTISIKY